MSTSSLKKTKRRAANRRGGSGRGISKAAALHAKEQLVADLRKSAERTAEQTVPLPAKIPEVLPGIPERAYLSAMGRQGSGDEVTQVLINAAKTRAEIDVPRADRPGETRPYKPAGALEFSHGQLRVDLLLAIRWGLQQGLPPPNELLDQLLVKLPTHLKKVYGDGLDILAVCLHVPNPFVEEALKTKGWRGAIPEPTGDDKVGGWNLHVQVYACRVRDRAIRTERQLFTHASDSVISSWQLRQLKVDLDLHRASRFRSLREPMYARWIASGGTEGRTLPYLVRKKYESGQLTPEAAIAAGVDYDLRRKDKKWKKAKLVHSLAEMNEMQVKAARESQAIDLLLAEWFTDEMEAGLPKLHPGYADLILKAREVFPELKRRQLASGHRLSLNEVLTLWEREQRAKDERARLDQAAREKSEQERAVAAAREALVRLQQEVLEKAKKDRLDLEAREKRERLERQEFEKAARDRLVSVVQQAKQEGDNKLKALHGAAKDMQAQAKMLFDLMQIVQAAERYNSKRTDVEFPQWWIDEGMLLMAHNRLSLGPGFTANLARVAAEFPEQAAILKAQAENIGYDTDLMESRQSIKDPARKVEAAPSAEKTARRDIPRD